MSLAEAAIFEYAFKLGMQMLLKPNQITNDGGRNSTVFSSKFVKKNVSIMQKFVDKMKSIAQKYIEFFGIQVYNDTVLLSGGVFPCID